MVRSLLADWYSRHGRHDLPWRAARDRWSVLVSEVMLQQTPVARVEKGWARFLALFPAPTDAAEAGPGAVISAWGNLGYPRRARRLYDSAVIITRDGWPQDLEDLPGIGRYTACAIRAQVDGANIPAIEVNIRRVCERVEGRRLTTRGAEATFARLGRGLRGRDRLLALMDLGATVCTASDPLCVECPLRRRCATKGVLVGETRSRQARYEGSFRQCRGDVLRTLRAAAEPVSIVDLDDKALCSLVDDGLAVVKGSTASLP
ncbi:MAG: A/G-specific adenine glycosylase [Acidimicrobiia bacterium]|nr:A/G-specific adenine glycosylase [Acidimicrobiia bacterium]